MQLRASWFWLLIPAVGGCATGGSLNDHVRTDDAASGGQSGAGGTSGFASGGSAGVVAGSGGVGGSTGVVAGSGGLGAGGSGATGGAAGGSSAGGASGTAGGANAGGLPNGGASAQDAAPDVGSGGDSCNGFVGLACPLGITVGAPSATSPSLGGSGGGAFTRACGPGEVLTGFDVRFTTGSSGEIRQLRPECSTVELVPVAGQNAFEVHTTNPNLLAVTGNDTGATYQTDRCPANQIVLGIVARIAGSEVRRFGFHCGSARVAPSGAPGTWELTVGPVDYSSPERGRDAGAVTTSYTCPSGTAATVLGGRSGDRIDQVNLGCAPLEVTVPCAEGQSGDCYADVAVTAVTHQVFVTEDATASLTCSSGTIQEFTSTYGAGCGGTCPVDCGQCTIGSTSCSVTYNNTNCIDCSSGCTKPGTLRITCE
jgi:hypothetical protein